MTRDAPSMPSITVPAGTGRMPAAVQWTWRTDRPADPFRSPPGGDLLRDLAASDGVTAVLPFRHKPLRHPDQPAVAWSRTVLALCPSLDQASALARARPFSPQGGLVAVDVLTGQPGLDMLYPKDAGPQRERWLIQWIEYVFSDPQHRDAYYRQQYAFSGPAMRRLYDRDCAGRFIGFEHVDRVGSDDRAPVWDVLHVVAFTPLQLVKSIPRFRRAWQAQAEATYGAGASGKAIMQAWEGMRVRLVARARQERALTRQSLERP